MPDAFTASPPRIGADLRRPGLLCVALLPLAWFPANLAAHSWAPETYRSLVSGETGLLELSQAAFYLLSAGAGGAAALALRRAGRRGLASVEAAIAALALLLALEEISWTQALFDWKTPAWLRARNHQGDFTLHNLEGLHAHFGDAAMLASLAAALAWAVVPRSWLTRLGGAVALLVPPPATALYFLPHGLFIAALKWQELFLGVRLVHVGQQEVFETPLAAGMFVLTECHRRAFREAGRGVLRARSDLCLPAGVIAWLVALVASTPARAQAPSADFERVASAAPAAPEPSRATETSGAELAIDGGRLLRRRGDEERELRAWNGAAVHALALAADPAGLTWILAERGLFVLSPEVDALDPVELGPGAPAGQPTSLWIDARRRVWIASDEGFGPIDPSFFWGRSFARRELPGPGPYRIASGANGELLLETALGTHAYRPDQGPPPAVTAVELDGRPLVRDELIALEPRSSPRLAARGEGAGGATLRWRRNGHHVWRELDGAIGLGRMEPGTHRIDVVALDRDLRRSEPFSFRVRLPYPLHYSGRFALTALALGSALIGAAFFARAVRRGAPGELRRAALSTAIAVVVLLQLVAGVAGHARSWPFVGFGMYCYRYDEGSVVYDEGLVGRLSGGGERSFGPQETGVAIDDRWQVLRPLVDGGPSALERCAAELERRTPELALLDLQVRARRTRLTRDGPVPIAPLVLAHWERAGDG